MSGRSISSLRNNEHRVPLVKTSSEWYRTREEPIQMAFSGQQREWHEMKLERRVGSRSRATGFLSISTVDVCGWTILCCGAVLCTPGCLAASLASTHYAPAHCAPPILTTKTLPRHCQMSVPSRLDKISLSREQLKLGLRACKKCPFYSGFYGKVLNLLNRGLS